MAGEIPAVKITMSWADINQQSKDNLSEVIETGWLSRHKFIPQFETAFSGLHGAKRGIFMNSGTDALRISLLTLKEIYGWRNGDEVIIPGLTFVATANAVLQSGLSPKFVDVQKETGNIEPKMIVSRLTRSTRAILAVHLFGLPADMPAVMQIARSNRLRVVEDSCEAVGVHRLAGDMACFSFYLSHHVQCGVGGMIATNSANYERVARSYMNHGRVDDGTHFRFGRIGYSSRATEMEAALGMGALKDLPNKFSERMNLAYIYDAQLRDVRELQINSSYHRIVDSSWMFYPIVVKRGSRDKLMRYLRKNGIESREAMPLTNQPCYKKIYKKGSCPNAEWWAENGLLLPLHPRMSAFDVGDVCRVIRKFLCRQ